MKASSGARFAIVVFLLCSAAAPAFAAGDSTASAQFPVFPYCHGDTPKDISKLSDADVRQYQPPSPAARDLIDALQHANAADIRKALTAHLAAAGRTPSDTQRANTIELLRSVAEACHERDAEFSAAQGLAASHDAVRALGGELKGYAPDAYRDVFAAVYVRGKLSKPAYVQAVAGFETFVPRFEDAP